MYGTRIRHVDEEDLEGAYEERSPFRSWSRDWFLIFSGDPSLKGLLKNRFTDERLSAVGGELGVAPGAH